MTIRSRQFHHTVLFVRMLPVIRSNLHQADSLGAGYCTTFHAA